MFQEEIENEELLEKLGCSSKARIYIRGLIF